MIKASHSRPHRASKTLLAMHRAFAEFLVIPTAMISGFLFLAAGTYMLDRAEVAWLMPIRASLQTHMFADAKAAGELLGTIAQGLFTTTSITISLLLIALQQSASALTHQVYDQFLRNWQNQFYFGFFVGVSLYTLVTLASIGALNPVIGATVALALTILALYLLLVLFYTTVDQMRPVVIIEAIHQHTLLARNAQLDLLRATRRTSRLDATVIVPVTAVAHGFVTRIDVASIRHAASRASAEVEVVLRVAIGDYIVFGQPLADVKARVRADAIAVGDALEDAIHREGKRDIATDPLDGIEELETIAWTSISTAQSDPDAGVLTIYSLRDILARWASEPQERADRDGAPVVYVDNVLPKLLNALESLAVSASESMQHQSYTEILRTFELLFDRLPPEAQRRVEDILLRTLPAMGEHVLTAELQTSLAALIERLEHGGRAETAAAVRVATEKLAGTIGKLGSRSTRAK